VRAGAHAATADAGREPRRRRSASTASAERGGPTARAFRAERGEGRPAQLERDGDAAACEERAADAAERARAHYHAVTMNCRSRWTASAFQLWMLPTHPAVAGATVTAAGCVAYRRSRLRASWLRSAWLIFSCRCGRSNAPSGR
jgi:hypothetical protein